MKFTIKYSDKIEHKVLFYDMEDSSFYTEPSCVCIDFDVVVNKVNLTITNDNKIEQIWGFCGCKEWIKTDFNTPKSKRGFLIIVENLEAGLCYKISNYDYPVYVNINTGWICIGIPEIKGNTVEFINNCIAVIDKNGEFISLWLKPKIISSTNKSQI